MAKNRKKLLESGFTYNDEGRDGFSVGFFQADVRSFRDILLDIRTSVSGRGDVNDFLKKVGLEKLVEPQDMQDVFDGKKVLNENLIFYLSAIIPQDVCSYLTFKSRGLKELGRAIENEVPVLKVSRTELFHGAMARHLSELARTLKDQGNDPEHLHDNSIKEARFVEGFVEALENLYSNQKIQINSNDIDIQSAIKATARTLEMTVGQLKGVEKLTAKDLKKGSLEHRAENFAAAFSGNDSEMNERLYQLAISTWSAEKDKEYKPGLQDLVGKTFRFLRLCKGKKISEIKGVDPGYYSNIENSSQSFFPKTIHNTFSGFELPDNEFGVITNIFKESFPYKRFKETTFINTKEDMIVVRAARKKEIDEAFKVLESESTGDNIISNTLMFLSISSDFKLMQSVEGKSGQVLVSRTINGDVINPEIRSLYKAFKALDIDDTTFYKTADFLAQALSKYKRENKYDRSIFSEKRIHCMAAAWTKERSSLSEALQYIESHCPTNIEGAVYGMLKCLSKETIEERIAYQINALSAGKHKTLNNRKEVLTQFKLSEKEFAEVGDFLDRHPEATNKYNIIYTPEKLKELARKKMSDVVEKVVRQSASDNQLNNLLKHSPQDAKMMYLIQFIMISFNNDRKGFELLNKINDHTPLNAETLYPHRHKLQESSNSALDRTFEKFKSVSPSHSEKRLQPYKWGNIMTHGEWVVIEASYHTDMANALEHIMTNSKEKEKLGNGLQYLRLLKEKKIEDVTEVDAALLHHFETSRYKPHGQMIAEVLHGIGLTWEELDTTLLKFRNHGVIDQRSAEEIKDTFTKSRLKVIQGSFLPEEDTYKKKRGSWQINAAARSSGTNTFTDHSEDSSRNK